MHHSHMHETATRRRRRIAPVPLLVLALGLAPGLSGARNSAAQTPTTPNALSPREQMEQKLNTVRLLHTKKDQKDALQKFAKDWGGKSRDNNSLALRYQAAYRKVDSSGLPNEIKDLYVQIPDGPGKADKDTISGKTADGNQGKISDGGTAAPQNSNPPKERPSLPPVKWDSHFAVLKLKKTGNEYTFLGGQYLVEVPGSTKRNTQAKQLNATDNLNAVLQTVSDTLKNLDNLGISTNWLLVYVVGDGPPMDLATLDDLIRKGVQSPQVKPPRIRYSHGYNAVTSTQSLANTVWSKNPDPRQKQLDSTLPEFVRKNKESQLVYKLNDNSYFLYPR